MSDDEFAVLDREADALELHFEKELLEGSFYSFVKAAWNLVEPAQPFVPTWHVEKLCTKLEKCYSGEIKRAIFNVPPGTAKSLIVCVLFPAWVWARNARKRFLTASYGQHLTTRDNQRCRALIESAWYQARWPVKMQEDQNAKTRYNTHKGGWRIATSVDGVGTGEHPHFIIIDDPTSAQQADSDAARVGANSWFDNTISMRLGLNPCIIIVMQRLHDSDLTGHVLSKPGGQYPWDHTRYPMRYEICSCPGGTIHPDENQRCLPHRTDATWTPDPTDIRTVEGELLAPVIFPEEKVRGMELALGPQGAAGQLQQRPTTLGGDLFKMDYFAGKFVDARPKLSRAVRGYDTAATDGGGDWTVGVLIEEEFEQVVEDGRKFVRSTNRFFISDVVRGQWGPTSVDTTMKRTAEADGKKVSIREEKEGGSAGKAVIETRVKTLKGFNYAGVTLTGGKRARVRPFRAQCEAGNVYIVRGAWNLEYLRELCAFDTGKHDDQVDASGCAFNAVLLEDPPKTASLTWGY